MAGTAQDLFEHGLRDMYDAEQKLVRALQRMAKKATNRELARGFTAHARTTARQAKRLEQIFRTLGRKPRDVFAAEAALKVEHYEIVSYKGLIDLADHLQMEDASELLQATLEEERETAADLEKLSKSLGDTLPESDDEEEDRRR
jgi:ferritin-like metal-binding protein YciE